MNYNLQVNLQPVRATEDQHKVCLCLVLLLIPLLLFLPFPLPMTMVSHAIRDNTDLSRPTFLHEQRDTISNCLRHMWIWLPDKLWIDYLRLTPSTPTNQHQSHTRHHHHQKCERRGMHSRNSRNNSTLLRSSLCC